MRCPNCNREVPNDKFCGFCGTPLAGAPVPSVNTGSSGKLRSSFKKAPDSSALVTAPQMGLQNTPSSSNTAVATAERSEQQTVNAGGGRFITSFNTDSDIGADIPMDKTLVSREELPASERKGIETKKSKTSAGVILLSIVVSVLAIVLGSLVGYMAAKGKIPFLAEENSDFHWSDTPAAIEIHPGE